MGYDNNGRKICYANIKLKSGTIYKKIIIPFVNIQLANDWLAGNHLADMTMIDAEYRRVTPLPDQPIIDEGKSKPGVRVDSKTIPLTIDQIESFEAAW